MIYPGAMRCVSCKLIIKHLHILLRFIFHLWALLFIRLRPPICLANITLSMMAGSTQPLGRWKIRVVVAGARSCCFIPKMVFLCQLAVRGGQQQMRLDWKKKRNGAKQQILVVPSAHRTNETPKKKEKERGGIYDTLLPILSDEKKTLDRFGSRIILFSISWRSKKGTFLFKGGGGLLLFGIL